MPPVGPPTAGLPDDLRRRFEEAREAGASLGRRLAAERAAHGERLISDIESNLEAMVLVAQLAAGRGDARGTQSLGRRVQSMLRHAERGAGFVRRGTEEGAAAEAEKTLRPRIDRIALYARQISGLAADTARRDGIGSPHALGAAAMQNRIERAIGHLYEALQGRSGDAAPPSNSPPSPPGSISIDV